MEFRSDSPNFFDSVWADPQSARSFTKSSVDPINLGLDDPEPSSFPHWVEDVSYGSQILAPPDLLSIAGLKKSATGSQIVEPATHNPTLLELFKSGGLAIKSESQDKLIDVVIPSPPIVAPKKSEKTAASMPSPVESKKRKAKKSGAPSRKKSRPEVQRRKRSEMNDRFNTLKILAVPDAESTPAIGRGDRSTNSKEAILRIASRKINSYRDQVKKLEDQLQRLQTRKGSPSEVEPEPLVSAEGAVQFNACFHNSSVPRLIITLDGAMVEFNEELAPIFDTTTAHLEELRKQGETAFGLVHPDCLPGLFHNITALLTGQQTIMHLPGCRSATTHQGRQAVFNITSWITYGKPQADSSGRTQTPVYFDCIFTPTGYLPVPENDTSRVIPAPL